MSISGRLYEPTQEEEERIEAARADFLRECDQIAEAIGDDGHFHGFDNTSDPYEDARIRFQARMREIVGI